MENITIDEYYNFERNKGYTHVLAEAEIRDLCDRENIIVSKIVRYDGYKVIGKKIEARKEYKSIKKVMEMPLKHVIFQTPDAAK